MDSTTNQLWAYILSEIFSTDILERIIFHLQSADKKEDSQKTDNAYPTLQYYPARTLSNGLQSPFAFSVGNGAAAVLRPNGIQLIPISTPPPLKLLAPKSPTTSSESSAAKDTAAATMALSSGSSQSTNTKQESTPTFSNDLSSKLQFVIPVTYHTVQSSNLSAKNQHHGMVKKRKRSQFGLGSASLPFGSTESCRRRRAKITDELRQEIKDFANEHMLLKQGEIADIFGK